MHILFFSSPFPLTSLCSGNIAQCESCRELVGRRGTVVQSCLLRCGKPPRPVISTFNSVMWWRSFTNSFNDYRIWWNNILICIRSSCWNSLPPPSLNCTRRCGGIVLDPRRPWRHHASERSMGSHQSLLVSYEPRASGEVPQGSVCVPVCLYQCGAETGVHATLECALLQWI